MHRIEWTNQLSVGVPLIDSQHKELIRICNGLLSAVAKKRGERVLRNVVRRLREYTVFHFSSEERFMDKVRFPGRGGHALEHERLKRSVKRYQRLLYEREDLTADEVLRFLKGWLLKHILSQDFELADYVHAHGMADIQL